MKDSQDIFSEIGDYLWSIFPQEADHIIFDTEFFKNGYGFTLKWCDLDGKRLGPFGATGMPDDITKPIINLILDLRKMEPFKSNPFSHFRYMLKSDSKIDVEFSYIPEWDTWLGLYLRGVSDLSEEEVQNPKINGIPRGIDYAHWCECRARRDREPY